MDSLEQMHAIAVRCPHFSPIDNDSINSKQTLEKGINCTMCKHYDNGLCSIKDEILTSLDQT